MHPGASENGWDDIDDDCDGTILVRRAFVSGMEGQPGSPLDQPPADFDGARLTRQPSSGTVLLDPMLGANSWIGLKEDLPWSTGRVHVDVAMESIANASCTLNYQWKYTPAGNQGLSVGVTHVDFTAAWPGDAIVDLRVHCVGAGTATIDWITVQNGNYEWPPSTDMGAEIRPMHQAGYTGQVQSIRSSPDGSWAMLVHSAGVVASTDLLSWSTRNGTGMGATTPDPNASDLAFIDQLQFSDVMLTDDTTPVVWAINGADPDREDDPPDYYLRSALLRSEDLGDSWTEKVPWAWSNARVSDCLKPTDTSKSWKDLWSTGHRIVGHPDDGEVVFYLDNGATSSRGLYMFDGTNSCLVSDFGDDEVRQGLNLSSLVIGADADGDPFMLVGSKALGTTGSPTTPTLYICELPATSCPTGGFLDAACTPVEAGAEPFVPDIRDIEVSPVDPSRFYFADGGFRTATDGSCSWTTGSDPEDWQDSTIWTLSVQELDDSVTWEVADTDNDDPEPEWLGSGVSSYADACTDVDHAGNLISFTPGYDLGSFWNVAIDPSGRWLYTSFDASSFSGFGRAYNRPRVFRLDLDDSAAVWQPIQEVGDKSIDQPLNREQRRDTTEFAPSFLEGEPWREAIPMSGIIAMDFIPSGDSAYLMLGGFIPFLILPEEDAEPGVCGWDDDPTASACGEDYDLMQVHVAWTDDAPHMQNDSSYDLAVCHDCGPRIGEFSAPDRVGIADWQAGDEEAFGRWLTGVRPSPDRDCHFTTLGGIRATDVWQEPIQAYRPQRWWAVNSVSDLDAGETRGFVFAEWDDEGEPGYDADDEQGWSTAEWASPCWDLVSEDARANFIDDATLGVALDCADGTDGDEAGDVDDPWYACDAEPIVGDEYHILDYELGFPTAILALDHNTAIIGASEACTDADCVTSGGAGLWIAQYRPGSGLIYRAIEGYTDEDQDQDASTTCTPAAMFTSGGALPDLALDRSAWLATRDYVGDEDNDPGDDQPTGTVRLFVLSNTAACGLVEVEFELDDGDGPITANWAGIDRVDEEDLYNYDLENPSDACTPMPASVDGISIGRDGQWLYVFGGAEGASGPYSVVGGVCAINVGAPREESGALYGWIDGIPRVYPMGQAVKKAEYPGVISAQCPLRTSRGSSTSACGPTVPASSVSYRWAPTRRNGVTAWSTRWPPEPLYTDGAPADCPTRRTSRCAT